MSTELLELRVRTASSVIVQTGECKTCRWKVELPRRLSENPNYVPYGGWEARKKCLEKKNYKNCSGYERIG